MAKARVKKPKLLPSQKEELRRASRDVIEAGMLRVAGYIEDAFWLPPQNSYLLKTVRKIDLQAKSKPPKFKKKPLTDYVAISCALHCIDGWSYLARAFGALVQGDSDAVRHLGYYAELRAAMALLASQGTGIFSERHVIIDKNGMCHLFAGRNGTHKAVWLFLEYWGERQVASAMVKRIVKPGNRPLSDWIPSFGVGPVTPRLIAQRWWKLWGLDLKRLSRDRDARNESSYRPTQLRNTATISTQVVADFIAEFWRIFQPWPPNFGMLDAHLLRKIWQETFLLSRSLPITDPAFGLQVEFALSQVQPTAMSGITWATFLQDTNESMLLRYAGRSDDSSAPDHHLQVLSRAALLLRLASGASEKLFESASVGRAKLDFWSSQYGLARGFWNNGGQPADMLDLWQDVEEALGSLDSWRAAINPATPFSALRREQAGSLQVLCECERIALWGLAS
jgi:hypothetical protein